MKSETNEHIFLLPFSSNCILLYSCSQSRLNSIDAICCKPNQDYALIPVAPQALLCKSNAHEAIYKWRQAHFCRQYRRVGRARPNSTVSMGDVKQMHGSWSIAASIRDLMELSDIECGTPSNCSVCFWARTTRRSWPTSRTQRMQIVGASPFGKSRCATRSLILRLLLTIHHRDANSATCFTGPLNPIHSQMQ